MPDAPEELRAFRKTITRDLYSFGLVMAYSLFSILPYDEEGEHDADTMTVQDWKLNQDARIFLHEQIIVYVLDFHSVSTPSRKCEHSPPNDIRFIK